MIRETRISGEVMLGGPLSQFLLPNSLWRCKFIFYSLLLVSRIQWSSWIVYCHLEEWKMNKFECFVQHGPSSSYHILYMMCVPRIPFFSLRPIFASFTVCSGWLTNRTNVSSNLWALYKRPRSWKDSAFALVIAWYGMSAIACEFSLTSHLWLFCKCLRTQYVYVDPLKSPCFSWL